MDSITATVRIALLHHAAGGFDETESLVALNRIGADVDLLRASDVETCLTHAAREAVDLVVLDRCSGSWVEQVLSHLATEGPLATICLSVRQFQQQRKTERKGTDSRCVSHSYYQSSPARSCRIGVKAMMGRPRLG